jgi:RNA polymerase sigma factor (TIGR02999 family)
MRSILVDYARARAAQKRGGGWKRMPLDEVLDRIELDRVDLLGLEEALARLEERSERQARVVELRFFAGLSIDETAEVLGVSHGTVETDWRLARAWLHRELSGEPSGEDDA